VERLAERRKEGETLAAIGDEYGVTRERVRQILVENYDTTFATDAVEGRAREREKAVEEWRDKLLDEVEQGAVLTRERVVKECPVYVRSVEEVMGEYAWAVPFDQAHTPKYTDDEILDALRGVWKKHVAPAPLSRALYDTHRLPTDPSGVRITQRYGWLDACKRAGVAHAEPTRKHYRALSREAAIEWMTAFLVNNDEPLSASAYDEWAREVGAPSMGSIRNVLGSWNAARAIATPNALRYVRKHRAGHMYPIPEKSGVAAHSPADIESWREYRRQNPEASISAMAEVFGVPRGTLRYHLEP
jgi:hypothetical protein